MATATRHANQYRLHLQQQLARVPQLKEMYAVASRSLAEVQQQVREGERPPNYAIRFEAEVARLGRELNELQNQTPGVLFNSCQDSDLRDELAVSKKLRQRAANEVASARQELQSAEEQISKLTGRLTENRGPSELASDGKPRNWAIIDGQLLLNDDVIPAASCDRYAAEWRAIRREISIAQEGLIAAEQRHAELDAKVNSIRQQMIDSPV